MLLLFGNVLQRVNFVIKAKCVFKHFLKKDLKLQQIIFTKKCAQACYGKSVWTADENILSSL